MDTIWAFRQGYLFIVLRLVSSFTKLSVSYDTAYKIKQRQDQYCRQALAGRWRDIGSFPEDLQWEALVDVLRGRVKVISTHALLD